MEDNKLLGWVKNFTTKNLRIEVQLVNGKWEELS